MEPLTSFAGRLGSLFPISSSVYEDAEDGTTNGWTAYAGGKIENRFDANGKRFISLMATDPSDSFRLGHEDAKNWDNAIEFQAYF